MLLKELLESKWSGAVKPKWKPEPGFFTKPADEIAQGLKDNSDDLKQAMSRLNFYINRAGDKLSAADERRLNSVKAKLRDLY
jgi:Mg2+ and Co2+ transporter CorA